MKSPFALIALALAPAALAQDSQPTSQPTSVAPAVEEENNPVAAAIEEAHNLTGWNSHHAIQGHLIVTFGGETRIDGTLLYDYQHNRVRIDQEDGTVILFDGEEAHVSPADAEFGGARFQALTWPYFLAMPFKLNDPGTHLETLDAMEFEGAMHETARLTFGEGVGDAPEDWYIVYADPETGLLTGAAYIVTYFRGGATGEEEPHAIISRGNETIDGVTISTEWEFVGYSLEGGFLDDALGSATFTGAEFVDPDESAFDAPEDSRIDALPGS